MGITLLAGLACSGSPLSPSLSPPPQFTVAVHTGLLSILQIGQVLCCLGLFALAVPSA